MCVCFAFMIMLMVVSCYRVKRLVGSRCHVVAARSEQANEDLIKIQQ